MMPSDLKIIFRDFLFTLGYHDTLFATDLIGEELQGSPGAPHLHYIHYTFPSTGVGILTSTKLYGTVDREEGQFIELL